MIKYLMSYSRCVHTDFSTADLDIIRMSRAANATHEITGFLHREAGFYLHYLEGHPSNLAQLEKNLATDSRHFDFTVMRQGERRERAFDKWAMGYSNTEATMLGLAVNEDPSAKFDADAVFEFLQAASKV